MTQTHTQTHAVHVRDAYAWLTDCFADCPDREDMTAEDITEAVERHYVGGFAAFLADGGY